MKYNLYAVWSCFDWSTEKWPGPYYLTLLELMESDTCGPNSNLSTYRKMALANLTVLDGDSLRDFLCP